MRSLAMLVTGLALGACASPPRPPDRGVRFPIGYSSYELDEVGIERTPGGVDEETSNVRRDRISVGFSRGIQGVAGFVDAVFERFVKPAGGDDRFKALGVRSGVIGRPWLARLRGDAGLVLPYRASLAFIVGENDFNDRALYYFEGEVQAGLGVEVGGVQVSTGVWAQYLDGEIEVPAFFLGPDVDREIEAGNVAAYAELGWRWKNVEARATVFGGEVDGVAVTLGAAF